jgi:hypothetical protein
MVDNREYKVMADFSVGTGDENSTWGGDPLQPKARVHDRHPKADRRNEKLRNDLSGGGVACGLKKGREGREKLPIGPELDSIGYENSPHAGAVFPAQIFDGRANL